MNIPVFEIIAGIPVLLTAGLLIIVTYDFSTNLESMDRRLDRRDARRAARQATRDEKHKTHAGRDARSPQR